MLRLTLEIDETKWWVERSRLRAGIRTATWFLAPITALLLPLSTSGGEIAFGLLAVTAFVIVARDADRGAMLRSPVGVAALLLVGWLTLSVFWTEAGIHAAVRALARAAPLLAVPVLVVLFEDSRLRRWTLWAFVVSMSLVFVGSLVVWAGFWRTRFGFAGNGAAFKSSITQSTLMVFAAAVLAGEGSGRWRWVSRGLAGLAILNVLVMVESRTGYVTVAALALLYGATHFGRRGLILGAAGMVVVAGLLYGTVPRFRMRIDLAANEATAFARNETVSTNSSIGLRLQFYQTSLGLAAERPLFGHGIGSFRPTYAHAASAGGLVPTANPHNQYLMTLVQSGVVGLALLLILFVTQWRTAGRLEPERRLLARPFVVIFAVGCLFNSMLVDGTEMNFFVLFGGLLFARNTGVDDGDEDPASGGDSCIPNAD